jgi:PTS system nitrogen regulatory IIA component
MKYLAKLLYDSHVLLGADCGSKKRVFEQAGLIFENNNGLARAIVFDSLFAREKLGSTGLGQGVAIPHGRIKGLKQAVGAFIRLETPIPFEAPDGRPVNLLFVLLVPESANEIHLQILSELATKFASKQFRESLVQAQDASQVCALFQS